MVTNKPEEKGLKGLMSLMMLIIIIFYASLVIVGQMTSVRTQNIENKMQNMEDNLWDAGIACNITNLTEKEIVDINLSNPWLSKKIYLDSEDEIRCDIGMDYFVMKDANNKPWMVMINSDGKCEITHHLQHCINKYGEYLDEVKKC